MSEKRKRDKDALALKASVRALNESSSRLALVANLRFLVDYYLHHPSRNLPDHLKLNPKSAGKV